MPSVYELHIRSTSLLDPPLPPSTAVRTAAVPRTGETSGERRIRLLRTVLGEMRTHGNPAR
jgi:hypothetical protein